MRRWAVIILASLMQLLPAATSAGEVQVSCYAPEGYSLYSPVPNVDRPSWDRDGMRNGRVNFEISDKSPDIVWVNNEGRYSAKENGATVIIAQVENEFVTIVVAYPEVTTELYIFDRYNRQMFWSQHRFGRMVDKMAALTAKCD